MIRMQDDSDGNTYQIWQQQQEMSCSIASLWMARSMVRAMSMLEDEWELAQRFYRNAVGVSQVAGGNAPEAPISYNPKVVPKTRNTFAGAMGNAGFTGGQIAAAIRAEGLNVQQIAFATSSVFSAHLLGERRAAVAFVRWKAGGGHVIVAARVANNGKVVFLDPGDGKINEQPNGAAFTANYGNIGTISDVLYLS